MKKIIRIQLSYYGDFHEIKYTPEVVTELFPILGGRFMPAIDPIRCIDTENNELTTENRVRFLGVTDKENIHINPERVNYNFSGDKALPFTELHNVVSRAIESLEKVLNFYTLIGNRLAINGALSLDIPACELFQNNIYTKPEYGPETNGNWELLRNKIQVLNVKERKEMANCVLKIMGRHPQTTDIEPTASFDINTLYENSLSRFNPPDIKYFAEESLKVIDHLVSLC